MVLAATGNYKNIDLISGYTSHDGAEMLGNEQYLVICIIRVISSKCYGQGRRMFRHFTYFLLLDDSFMYVYLTANIKEADAESYITEHFDEVAPSILDYREDDDVPVYLTRRTFEYFTGGPYLQPADDFVKVKGLLLNRGRHCIVLVRGKGITRIVTTGHVSWY